MTKTDIKEMLANCEWNNPHEVKALGLSLLEMPSLNPFELSIFDMDDTQLRHYNGLLNAQLNHLQNELKARKLIVLREKANEGIENTLEAKKRNKETVFQESIKANPTKAIKQLTGNNRVDPTTAKLIKFVITNGLEIPGFQEMNQKQLKVAIADAMGVLK